MVWQLKCSRRRPACDRCRRLGFQCSFPPPPDRKLLATLRSSARKRRADDCAPLSPDPGPSSSAATTVRATSGPVGGFVSIASQSPGTTADAAGQSHSCSTVVSSLCASLQRLLIDTYFSHMYNASLIYHQESFLRDFHAGAVPRHSLLAVFASATVYVCCYHTMRRRFYLSRADLQQVSKTSIRLL